MFICSVTLTKEKLALILAICLFGTLLLGIGLSYISPNHYYTHTARRRFLAQYDWQTDENPFLEETLTLPQKPEEFSHEYETLQNQQGFSLIPYLGKTLKKYTYRVTNHPNTQAKVYANVLVYHGKIVACDIVCPDFQNGFSEPVIRKNIPVHQDVMLKKHKLKKGKRI